MLTVTSTKAFSLEEFIANPPDYMKWVDGQLLTLLGLKARGF